MDRVQIWVDAIELPTLLTERFLDDDKVNHVMGDDLTPKARRISLQQSSRKRSYDDSSIGSEASSEQSTASKKSSSAIVRQERSLEHDGILFKPFDDEGGILTEMRLDIEELSAGHGILYEFEREDLPPIECRLLSNTLYEREDRLKTGAMPDPINVMEIVKATKLLLDRPGSPETWWNTQVHDKILALAQRTSSYSSKIAIADVRSARVMKRLSSRHPSKIVDYAVVLEPDLEIKEAFRKLPKNMSTWNHVELIDTQPLAVSIETKSAATSWTNGRPQIGLWIDAWLRRLQLLGADSHPPIPVLYVQGADWFLSFAEGHITIRGHIHIGTTLTALGTMKVLAVLHYVMAWAELVWRPHFMSIIRSI